MLPRKILKIKGQTLAKNVFFEISARKNLMKMGQHVALLPNLGLLKNCLLALGGELLPLPPASYGPGWTTVHNCSERLNQCLTSRRKQQNTEKPNSTLILLV